MKGTCLLLKSMPERGYILSDEALKSIADRYKGKTIPLGRNAGKIYNIRYVNSAIHCDFELIFNLNVSLKPMGALDIPGGKIISDALIGGVTLVAPAKKS